MNSEVGDLGSQSSSKRQELNTKQIWLFLKIGLVETVFEVKPWNKLRTMVLRDLAVNSLGQLASYNRLISLHSYITNLARLSQGWQVQS